MRMRKSTLCSSLMIDFSESSNTVLHLSILVYACISVLTISYNRVSHVRTYFIKLLRQTVLCRLVLRFRVLCIGNPGYA